MIEVFQGDNFTLEFENIEGNFSSGSYFCDIVTDKPKSTESGVPPIEVWDTLPTSNKIVVDLSAKNLTPSKKYAPFKWFIRLTIKDNKDKQVTVFQEELYVKELFK